MKKIFTLIGASLFSVALFAADRKPVVTLKSDKNYEIVIDGQSYTGNGGMISLANLRSGQHTIKVYQASRSFMFKRAKKVVVSSSSFSLKNNSVAINVDFRGQISISESRMDRDWNNNDHGIGRGNNQKDMHD
jgi:hypothetical protein